MSFVFWFFIYFFGGNCILPGWGAFEVGILPTIIILITSVNLAYISAYDQSGRLLVPGTFWVFTYVFMCLAPLSQILGEGFPWFDHYSEDTIDYGWMIVLLGLLAYMAGFKVNSHELASVDSEKYNIVSVRVEKIAPILFITALGLTLFGVMYNGGFGVLFMTRLDAFSNMASTPTSTYMLMQSLMRVPIFLVLMVVCHIRYSIGGLGWAASVLFFVVFIVNNPVSTPRYWVGAVAISVILLYFSLVNKRLLRLFPAFLIFILVMVFPLMDAFRKSLDVDLKSAIQEFSFTLELQRSPDFDAFQQLLNTIHYVQLTGYEYGNQIVTSIFFWVPRNIWPDKSVASGELVAEFLGYKFKNLSSPLWAEWYIDFGLFGVVIGMFLYGYMSKRLTLINVMSHWYLLPVFFSAYQIYLLRGSLMVTSNFLVVYFAILALIIFGSTKRFGRV